VYAASRDIILLKEVLDYLIESIEDMSIPPMPLAESGKRLYKVSVLLLCALMLVYDNDFFLAL
jgi:hypothetical protein